MVFFTLLIPPIVIILLFILVFGRNRYTIKEAAIVFGIGVFLAGTFAGCEAFNSKQWDNEYVNGKVLHKEREKVSCSHSYDCHCYNSCSGSGRNKSCTRVCSTCYEHSYDVDWMVYTDIPNRFEIDRVDRRGMDMPDRWQAVVVGEPVTTTRSYTNYIKGAPESLFYYQDKQALKKYPSLPHYPMRVYDYYRAMKVWDYDGVLGSDKKQQWNKLVNRINADLGPKFQMNLQLIAVNNRDRDYFQALRTAWLGGKKNDILVVVSVDDKLVIQWTDIMAWPMSYSFIVALRDNIQDLKTLDERIFPTIIRDIQENFRRKPMREFEYLSNMATPSPTFFFWALLIEVIFCIGASVWFTINDFTYEDENDLFGGLK